MQIISRKKRFLLARFTSKKNKNRQMKKTCITFDMKNVYSNTEYHIKFIGNFWKKSSKNTFRVTVWSNIELHY